MGVNVVDALAVRDDVVFGGEVKGSNASGPSVLNEAASFANPTLCPDKSDPDTGIAHRGANILSLAIGGYEGRNYSLISNKILVAYASELNSNLTADSGSSQGDGVIIASLNVYATVVNAGDAATLPATFLKGTKIHIKNDASTNAMDVFPASGDDAGAGANTAVSIAAGSFAVFLATVANTTWTKIAGGTA